ncbi:MAG: MoaD/ThiS family protein [Deltaproteobacteria bacterium]|nr:MoaD/ThiS family protein [Deltaproteobacteria bacterium]
MKVKLLLFGGLRDYLPEKSDNRASLVDLPEETRIKDLLDRLSLPAQLPKIIFLNGVKVGEEEGLTDGDRLSIFPPMVGG